MVAWFIISIPVDSNEIRYPDSQLNLICYLGFSIGRAYMNFDIYHLKDTFWNSLKTFSQTVISSFCNCKKKFLAIQDRGIAFFALWITNLYYVIIEKWSKTFTRNKMQAPWRRGAGGEVPPILLLFIIVVYRSKNFFCGIEITLILVNLNLNIKSCRGCILYYFGTLHLFLLLCPFRYCSFLNFIRCQT